MTRTASSFPAWRSPGRCLADGKSYLFKLRKGVKFHDGKELTAEDVKWSVDYAMDPNNGATGLSMLKSVERVNVKDKLTVEFVLKSPHAGFLSMVATIRPFPIVPSRSVPSGKLDLPGFPPGTGPFVFKDYKPAREIVFVRNKNYWRKGLPYLDELVLKPVLEDQVRFTGVRAGDLDMIERTPYSLYRQDSQRRIPRSQNQRSQICGLSAASL